MNPLTPAIKAIGRQPWLPKLAPVIVGLDRALVRVSGGRLTVAGIAGLPELMLTVRGRKSGLPRTTPLLYVPHGGDYLIVGSNWGKPKPPLWSLNLLADPTATISVKGRETAVVARLATGQERAELWQVLLGTWPAYADYAKRTDREIKVFVLSERPAE